MLYNRVMNFCSLRTISARCKLLDQNCVKRTCAISHFFKSSPKPVQTTRLLSTDVHQPVKLKENNVIYIGPLRKQIKLLKLFSLSSSFIGFALQPYIVYSVLQVSTAFAVGTVLISTMFLATPFLIHFITKRYVTELYFDNSTKVFTAKTLTLINKVREIKFTANDVSVPTLPGILSSFHVRDIPLFVDRRMIEDPDAYEHMMGLDKPLEFFINGEMDKKK